MRTIVLSVTAMHCPSCVANLTRQLKATEGVSDVELDLPTGTAKVAHDENICKTADLVSAVRRVGFQVDSFRPADA